MKKNILALSALGCIATVGVVFAAFTLDPTNESGEIPNTDIDVDLSSHVFSTFEPIKEFDYKDETGQTLLSNVPVNKPTYIFRPKDVYNGEGAIVGSTLDLRCNNYNLSDFHTYIDLKNNPVKEGDPGYEEWLEKVKEATPRGYAFKYEYDADFLRRIEIDDKKPSVEMEDWQYAIYKTSFSSGLTKSDFKSAKLLEYGIHYQDPIEDKPNYKELDWDKTAKNWEQGTESFLIQPNIDPETGKVTNSGVIVFTGAEMTENLFEGRFIDDKAIANCKEYLNETEIKEEVEKYIHRNFSLKIKVSEYFKVEEHELVSYGTAGEYEYRNNDPDEDRLLSGSRYAFDFIVDETADELFKEGYQLDKFYISDGEYPVQLITDISLGDKDASALGLKVTLDSPYNGKSDITRFFKYGLEQGEEQGEYYNTIYFDDTVATNAVGYLPEKGDVIKFEFTYKKTNTGEAPRGYWRSALLNMVKPIKDTFRLEEDPTTGIFTYDAEATPISMKKGLIYRFTALIDFDRSFDTFIMSDGTDPIVLTSDMVTLYIGSMMNLQKLDSTTDYEVKTDGSIVFDGDAISQKYRLKAGDSLFIDVKNTGEEDLTLQSAQLTTTLATKHFMYSSIYTRSGDALSSGYFSLRSGVTTPIRKGATLVFEVNVAEDHSFWESITKLQGSTVQSSGFEFNLAMSGQSIALAPEGTTTLNFRVERVNKDKEVLGEDTASYAYYSETNSIKTTNMEFIKEWEEGDFYYIFITIEYQGKDYAEFNQAPFALNIVA